MTSKPQSVARRVLRDAARTDASYWRIGGEQP